MAGYRFEIRKGSDGKFYVRFRSLCGDALFSSAGFDDRGDAEHLVTQLQVYGPGAPVLDYSRRGAMAATV